MEGNNLEPTSATEYPLTENQLNETKGWSQAIGPRPVELEKEILFLKKILKLDWVKFC